MAPPVTPPRVAPTDARRVDYFEARNRYLTRFKSGTLDAVALAEVGRFVVDRWMAEYGVCGEQFDEPGTAHVWDECSERHIRDLNVEAAEIFNDAVRARFRGEHLAHLKEKFRPALAAGKVAKWVTLTVAGGIVGAISVVVFGAALVKSSPAVAQLARESFESIIPKKDGDKDQSKTVDSTQEGSGVSKANAAPTNKPNDGS